ncbi:MAG: protein-glutamine glutaminase family protein [Bacteroidetes bacterium]|nr:protein-glutamine glutaminase family protein [Bacteroidota bacterium]
MQISSLRTRYSWRAFFPVLIVSILIFSSCQKNKTAPDVPAPPKEATAPGTERLLSVANVYYTNDGRNVEAWFYETPLVFEFSRSGANAKANFELLQKAKDNKLLVNVRLVPRTENLIDLITPANDEQIAKFREESSKRVAAEAVPSPYDPNAASFGGSPNSSLISVVPNITTLNTIFNTIKNQCCQSPGLLIYGTCIPFQFVTDGCYARAHKMRQIIESYYGYTSYKVFNYACSGSATLSVNATLWGNNCCVKWWYHVTSYVFVQSRTGAVAYAIDPAMFKGPVPIATWLEAQKNVSCGYNGAPQGQRYFASNAYTPGDLNASACSINIYIDNNYTAATNTCISYSGLQGCSF